jgi:hypothetical protein
MADADSPIATHYRIDPVRPAPVIGGGMPCFAVTDRRDASLDLMAVMTRKELPARPRMTLARGATGVPHAVMPVEYGPGRDPAGTAGWFVVFEALPGPAVGLGITQWREQELIGLVLQPAASALQVLAARGLTHRSINPDNLFRAGAGAPVTLGPFWAWPPASLQPSVFEPPYMARCVPTGRGDGVIADDVYALGVTLLALLLGRVPMAGMSDLAILRRKVEVGSYAALTEGGALTPMIADLLKGMLAEDPDHRPPPAMLLRPELARSRRVAARPPRRALQKLTVGGDDVWTARELAQALGAHPEPAYALLKNGQVERWLRRHLGDPQLGMQVEEVIRHAGETGEDDVLERPLLVMRAAVAVDPRAPLFWRGFAVQPDGIGPALVGAAPELSAALQEIVLAQAAGLFLAANRRRSEDAAPIEDERAWRSWLTAPGPAGGLNRLLYGMNPMLACGSPLLAGQPVVRVADLLPGLEAASAGADRTKPPIDPHIAAFLVARLDASLGGELAAVKSFGGAEDRMAVLRLYGQLQTRLHPDKLPGLAAWLVTAGFATVTDLRHQPTRAALQKGMEEAASAGQINTILRLAENPAARLADAQGAAAAAARVKQLQAALRDIESGAKDRSGAASALGQEIVAGLGALAGLGVALNLALG